MRPPTPSHPFWNPLLPLSAGAARPLKSGASWPLLRMSGHQEARRAMPITQSTPASVAAHPDLTVRCGRTAAAHRLDAELVVGAARHINQALACAGPDATQRSRFIASAVSMLQALR